MKLSHEEIEGLVRQAIESDENLGDQSSGSGHLGYVSYVINDIHSKVLEEDKIEVRYSYTIMVETEFTYYPDNPPMEYQKNKKIIIDKNKKITKP